MSDPKRPDIVFFMLDQLSARWADTALAGACPVPNLRRLMERGTTFTNAITSNPVCCPARATLATGMTTRQHGVLQNGYELDPALPTFMRSLQRAGYRTGALGKVHLHAHFHGLHPDYREYGYDVVHNTEDPRGGEWLDWILREHPQHADAALAQIWSVDVPEFAAYGPSGENLRERILAIRRSFEWGTRDYPQSTWGYAPLHIPTELSQTEWITRHAEQFIRETPAGTPLHAHVSYVQPHSPFYPPAEYLPLVDASRIPAPAPAEWVEDPHGPRYLKDNMTPSDLDWSLVRPYYFADIAHLDAQLGRVLSVLEETGRLEGAYIVLLADHGEHLGDHGFRGKEEEHYDACIRVPLIVSGPALQRGATCDEMVQLEDLCPTVLDMATLHPPHPPKQGHYLKLTGPEIPVLAGRSLLPLCRGERPGDWRTEAYCESYNSINSVDPTGWARTVRTKEYRYTWYPNGGGEQLFRLIDDPDEQRNLLADPALARTRQHLRDRLMECIVMQDYPHPLRELLAHGVH